MIHKIIIKEAREIHEFLNLCFLKIKNDSQLIFKKLKGWDGILFYLAVIK